jgi:hypothetical protein
MGRDLVVPGVDRVRVGSVDVGSEVGSARPVEVLARAVARGRRGVAGGARVGVRLSLLLEGGVSHLGWEGKEGLRWGGKSQVKSRGVKSSQRRSRTIGGVVQCSMRFELCDPT